MFGIVYSEGLTGITFGLLISSLCSDETSALILGSGIVFPIWLICGVFWPIESMEILMQRISYLLPLTIPIKALSCVMSRGWDLMTSIVVMGYTTSFIYSIIMFLLSCFIFYFSINHSFTISALKVF